MGKIEIAGIVLLGIGLYILALFAIAGFARWLERKGG
jgi:hypothetical protein